MTGFLPGTHCGTASTHLRSIASRAFSSIADKASRSLRGSRLLTTARAPRSLLISKFRVRAAIWRGVVTGVYLVRATAMATIAKTAIRTETKPE